MNDRQKLAYKLIIFLGMVSLFGDITYEGGRSISGPFLSLLGASAFIVGLVSGLGEFLGYALRLISGYLADKTKFYWLFTFIGYGLILSIPFLAFAHHWELAAVLLLAERMGKAIRTPARDAILSYASKSIGTGLGFGLHEALDQVGAIIGPLIFTATIVLKGTYRQGLLFLFIPGLLTVISLTIARISIPHPEKLELKAISQNFTKINPIFWHYSLFTFFSLAGFINFPLIAYHFKIKSLFSDSVIPLLFAMAMAIDAFAALLIGKTYDRIGLKVLLLVPLLSLPIPISALYFQTIFPIISLLLWGIVMSAHETIMRAAIADFTPLEKRGFGYGIFNTIYGAGWLFSSAIMGFLYELSLPLIFLFSIIMEILALSFFIKIIKNPNIK